MGFLDDEDGKVELRMDTRLGMGLQSKWLWVRVGLGQVWDGCGVEERGEVENRDHGWSCRGDRVRMGLRWLKMGLEGLQ